MFERLKENLMLSEYKYFHVKIEAGYSDKWTPEKSNAFFLEVTTRLTWEGFWVVENIHSSCPTIKQSGYLNDKMSLYLHPAEIVGYATEEQMRRVLAVLDNCEVVKRIGRILVRDVYDLSDEQYEKLLANNASDILMYYQSFKHSIKRSPYYDIGLNFAHEYRIPRVGDRSGYSSSDVDVKFINNLVTVFEKLHVAY